MSPPSAAVVDPDQPQPPPLDVYKNLSLIRSAQDSVIVSITGPSGPSPPPNDAFEVNEILAQDGTNIITYKRKVHDLSNASSAALPPKKKLDIPVPHIMVNDSYLTDVSADYSRPKEFIRYKRLTPKEREAGIDYNLDTVDMEFLENHEKWGKNGTEREKIEKIVTGGRSRVNEDLDGVPEELRKFYEGEEEEGVGEIEVPRFTTTGGDLPKYPNNGGVVFTLTPSILEAGIDLVEKMTDTSHPVTLDSFRQKFVREFSPHGCKGTKAHLEIASDIYKHWLARRVANKLPLLRMFWPPTSSNDTNPHAVFRPRAVEKYKLRRMRKDDVDSFRKMQILRMDFERTRQCCRLVKKREEVALIQAKVEREQFEQNLYDCVDTSGEERTPGLDFEDTEKALVVKQPDFTMGGGVEGAAGGGGGGGGANKRRKLETEEGGGEIEESRTGVPLFTEWLPGRVQYRVVDGEVREVGQVGAVVSNYLDPTEIVQTASRFLFKHRGRIGRGGRVLIDRIPKSLPPGPPHASSPPPGGPSPSAVQHHAKFLGGGIQPFRGGLLDLVPPPFSNPMVRESVNEIGSVWTDDEEEEVVGRGEWAGEDKEIWGGERDVWDGI
ncbi:hypothetical protein TrRE_jg6814 [Triparma retinervis]|uniref:Enhancer of polycomb-like protein n=1 Tax=Triparma retinervis TaxID=2557542 RepID=A0A9W7AFX0_9STRA|nr:hypothetical protein TrRE_jg6814 [Triparma retinervis]